MTASAALIAPLAGGLLIGLAVALLFVLDGRVAGVSGIVAGLVRPVRGEWGWRALFVAGLVSGGMLARVVDPSALGPIVTPLPLLAIAGGLVGFGTRLAGGCTSGHGVCGVSRGATRSMVATGTFLSVAAIVVFFVRHGGGR